MQGTAAVWTIAPLTIEWPLGVGLGGAPGWGVAINPGAAWYGDVAQDEGKHTGLSWFKIQVFKRNNYIYILTVYHNLARLLRLWCTLRALLVAAGWMSGGRARSQRSPPWSRRGRRSPSPSRTACPPGSPLCPRTQSRWSHNCSRFERWRYFHCLRCRWNQWGWRVSQHTSSGPWSVHPKSCCDNSPKK